jgi:hypothetical protein
MLTSVSVLPGSLEPPLIILSTPQLH